MHTFWHDAAYVVTFPEGLIWPALRHGWYAAVCAAGFAVGLVAFTGTLVAEIRNGV